MIVSVNNTQKDIPENTSIEMLLKELKHTQNGIAVAINETVVLKHLWNQHLLNDNDNVLIIQATQGG